MNKITPSSPRGQAKPFNRHDDLEAYMRHEADFDDGIGGDGCYYCGGLHPSDSCMSEDRAEFYRGMEV